MKILLYLLAALAASATLSACSAGEPPDPSPGPEADPAASFINPRNAWRDPDGIPVCFLGVPAAQRALIRRTVEREYTERAGLDYTGWGDCSELSTSVKAVRIDCNRDPNYSPAGHSTVGPSTVRRASESTMVLRCENCQGDGKFCRHLVLHEFGHAMALWHEHERDDSSCDQGQAEREDRSHVKVGSYDRASVMNYCSTTDTLSAGDLAGLQRLYPGARGTAPTSGPTSPPPTTAPPPTAAPPPPPPPGGQVPGGCERSRTSCWNEAETREMEAWAQCEPRLAPGGAIPPCLEPLRRLTGPLADVRRMYQHACDQGQQPICRYLRSLDQPAESPALLSLCNAGVAPNVDPACKRLRHAPWLLAASTPGLPGTTGKGGQVDISIGGQRWTLGW